MKKYFRISQIGDLKVYRGGTSNGAYDMYEYLSLNNDLKSDIKDKIKNRKDFSISIEQLKLIKESNINYLKVLLGNPEFDPFKEILREKYPEQYGEEYIDFEGVRYYVRGKGHPLDLKIIICHNFHLVLLAHINEMQELEYVFY